MENRPYNHQPDHNKAQQDNPSENPPVSFVEQSGSDVFIATQVRESENQPAKTKSEKTKEYQKRYRQQNREKMQEYQRNYYQKNKKKIDEAHRLWWQQNREKMREYARNYYYRKNEQT